MKTPEFPADVSEKGALQMPANTRRAMEIWLLSLVGKRVVVRVSEEESLRSLKANAYYWSQVMTVAEEANIGYTKDEFHELMLAKFATKKHYEIVDRATGEVVEEYDITQRSHTMRGKPFYDFVEQVRQFLAEFYDVVTEDPDPEYWRKRKVAA